MARMSFFHKVICYILVLQQIITFLKAGRIFARMLKRNVIIFELTGIHFFRRLLWGLIKLKSFSVNSYNIMKSWWNLEPARLPLFSELMKLLERVLIKDIIRYSCISIINCLFTANFEDCVVIINGGETGRLRYSLYYAQFNASFLLKQQQVVK